MDARVHLISLGVRDLVVSSRFYEALGFRHTEASTETISFMQLHHQLLGLYPSDKLEEDAEIPLNHSGHPNIVLAQTLPSKASVDAVFETLPDGATIIKPPQDVFWGGYSGYFSDPDDHLWEIAYNPFFEWTDDGKLKLTTPKKEDPNV